MSLKERMMDRMMNKMSKEEKREMMDSMMEKFLADMTPEEKREMMMGMMPKMMGGMMESMSSMMGEGDPGEMNVSDEMFERMRSHCAQMGFDLTKRDPKVGP
jgi:deoxyhypusine synthase